MSGTVVRMLGSGLHQATDGVAARALADGPTAVATDGIDPLEHLTPPGGELSEWFAVPPERCAAFDEHRRRRRLGTDKERAVRFSAAHRFEAAGRWTIVGVPTGYVRRDPRA